MTRSRCSQALSRWAMALCLLSLMACGSNRPKPAELPAIVQPMAVQTLWSFALGEIKIPMVPVFTPQGRVVLTTSAGELVTLQMANGQLVERVSLKETLSAAVGSDGKRHAIVTRNNQLIAIEGGKEAWRQGLSAQVFTPPLVAGERVFVLLADRTVQAYDGASGRLLWTQARAGEPLVLSQSGTLMSYGNTLVAGLTGRLTGFDPTTGRIWWDAPMADMVVASEDAQFRLRELERGIPPCLAMAPLLDRMPRLALSHLVLTAGQVDAVRAWSWGLVGEICPAQQLIERTQTLTSRVLQFNDTAVLTVKRYLAHAPGHDVGAAARLGAQLLAQALSKR